MLDKNTKIIIGIAAVLVVALIVVLILSSNDPSVTGNVVNTQSEKLKSIKIGVSLPLTGEGASLGEGGLTGIELAQKEINENGGINGRKIELIVEDDLCNARGGVNSLTKLTQVDDVTAIIGPLCSVAAGAGLPVVEESRTPILIWGSAPHLTMNNEYVFRTYPSDSFQGKFGAEYMYNELGKRKVAVVYVQNDWGDGIQKVFIQRFKDLGGEVVFVEGVAQDTKDLRSTITKVKSENPDGLYLPVYPEIAVIGLKQIKEAGLNIQILSGDVMETPDVIESGYADGVRYTLGKISNPSDFAEKVKRETGKTSEFATPIGYDSLYILAEIIGKVGADKEAIRDELQSYRKTNGVSLPLIEFDENGDLNSAEFDIRLIQNKESKVIN